MKRLALLLLATAFTTIPSSTVKSQPTGHTPDVPRVWDDAAMSGVELPLAARIPVHHVSSDYYYRIPERPNLKTYPIYAPGKEPTGYWDWLLQQEPQPAFDPASLHTDADWIKAGEASSLLSIRDSQERDR